MFSHCTTDKPEPHGTTARLKYATPKEEEVRKLSSSDLKDYAGGAAVGSGAGAGVVGAGIGALIGGIVGSIVPGPGTALGFAAGVAFGVAIGATAGGIGGVGVVHHAKTKKREKTRK